MDEALPIKVRITNLSGQPIQLGHDPDWLNFQIQFEEPNATLHTAQIPANDPYTLQSAKTVVRQINLMPYFRFNRVGQYSISATIRIKNWDQDFTSAPKVIQIGSGFSLWEQEFGVPTTNSAPDMRKYTLLQANNANRLMLYFRLTDASETHIYRVFPIGQLVSFSKPEAQLDKDSNLHVLSQFGPRSFIYMVLTPQGEIQTRQCYDYSDTRPVLRPKNDKVVVTGGIRHITDEDIPPFHVDPPTRTTNATAKPKP